MQRRHTILSGCKTVSESESSVSVSSIKIISFALASSSSRYRKNLEVAWNFESKQPSDGSRMNPGWWRVAHLCIVRHAILMLLFVLVFLVLSRCIDFFCKCGVRGDEQQGQEQEIFGDFHVCCCRLYDVTFKIRNHAFEVLKPHGQLVNGHWLTVARWRKLIRICRRRISDRQRISRWLSVAPSRCDCRKIITKIDWSKKG